MTPYYRTSVARDSRRHLRIILLVAAVLLPAGPLRADTITLKTDTGTLPVEGAISEINAKEIVYTSDAGGREIREPIDSVLRIEAPKEPELTAAEQAYADAKWADAAALYHRTLTFSSSDWAKYRALVRLIDAGAKSHDLSAAVEGFVKLARLDPANAPARQPEITDAKKEELSAALKDVQAGLTDAGPEAKLVLLPFLGDLHTANDEPKLAAEARDQIEKLRLAAAPADPAKPGEIAGPHGPLFDNAAHARRIIFICDASGSMLNKMATLKDQLQKAVDGLKPIQFFNIIFMQDEKCVALDKSVPVPADAKAKRNAAKFLDDVTTSGTTDPIPALTLGFQQRPQLIYLLTDGDFPDNKAVSDTIAKLNADHKIKVNTIAFVNNADTDTEFLTLLKQIAKDSGGSYKNVREEELTGK